MNTSFIEPAKEMNLGNPSRSSGLAERILDTFPAGNYALMALLRLVDIVETTEVPTAAVECRVQPRMLINPQFVQRHANTPEKLLALVMHELHHVLLGHTTLFPRLTPVQNFVFDAVINGVVCRMLRDPLHVALFEDYYPDHVFPACLLRPPPGWTRPPPIHLISQRSQTISEDERDSRRILEMAPGIAALPNPWRARAHDVHQALYSHGGASYDEVYAVLPALLEVAVGPGAQVAEGSQPNPLDELLAEVPLLGGHAPEQEEDHQQLEQLSPLMFDIVRSIVEQWPQPPDPIRGRSLADVIRESGIRPGSLKGNRVMLRNLIRRIARQTQGEGARRLVDSQESAMTPVPSLSRRSVVLQQLGVQPLLHPNPVTGKRRAPVSERVHVYLDVSGSMDGVKDALYGAVLDNAAIVHPEVHLFSTQVEDISLAELRKGQVRTTGGTALNCVADHIRANHIQRAIVITDGWVGTPQGSCLKTLCATRLGVAYLGENTNERDLARVAHYTIRLNAKREST